MGNYGIDPFSEYSLYDVLENDYNPMEDNFHFEYHGFHLTPQGNGRYHVQLDGHAGSVMSFDNDDYDDVLELVADLNDVLIEYAHYDYQDDKAELVDWAGKIMTGDKEKADEEPELYLFVPKNPEPIEG